MFPINDAGFACRWKVWWSKQWLQCFRWITWCGIICRQCIVRGTLAETSHHFLPLRTLSIFKICAKTLSCAYWQALEITVWRDGKEYHQKYTRGRPVTDLICHELPADFRGRQGTCVHFWPDKEGRSSVSKLHWFLMSKYQLHENPICQLS